MPTCWLRLLLGRCGDHIHCGRHVPHSWQWSSFTTINARTERLRRISDPATIELMLAHVPEN